jgi:hypothetical protein
MGAKQMALHRHDGLFRVISLLLQALLVEAPFRVCTVRTIDDLINSRAR